MTEPDDGWRVRMGAGLLMYTPMSPERREQFDREAEREAKAAEFEAEQRREAALEHRWELQRQGVEPRSVGDVLLAASVAADRQDRRDKKRDEDAAVLQDRPAWNPDHTKYALKASAAAKRELAETTPATQAEVKREIEKGTAGLKVALWRVKHGRGLT
jgi:hypothetical protein